MEFSKKIKNLEKRGIISKKPNPIIPFVLSFIILILGVLTLNINTGIFWARAFFYLAGFTFVFAILHLIVVKIVENKK